MTIEHAGVIDGMGADKKNGALVLLIADHLAWDDANHAGLLEKKINCYLDFIRSGQILEHLPDAGGRVIRIELVHKYEPIGPAVRMLDAVQEQLARVGIAFVFHGLDTGGESAS
jgi:hypothetical protein